MVFILIGVALGILVAVGPLGFMHAPFDAITQRLVEYGNHVALDLTTWVSGSGSQHHNVGGWAQALAVGLAVLMPGLICALLLLAARARMKLKRILCVGILVGAFASFAVVGFWDALILVVFSIALVTLLEMATGAFVVVPLAVLATILSVRTVTLVLNGDSETIKRGVDALQAKASLGTHSWELILATAAIAPFIAVAWGLLDRDTASSNDE